MRPKDTLARQNLSVSPAGDKPRRRVWLILLVWVIWLLCIALAMIAPILHTINQASPRTLNFPLNEELIALTFPTVGGVIAARRPRNPIGWLFCFAGLSQALKIFAGQYAVFALFIVPDTLPLGAEAAWLYQWVWAPGFILSSTFVLLLFPSGRLLSPRWRWAAIFGAGATALWIAPIAIFMWPLRGPTLIALNDNTNQQPIAGLDTINMIGTLAFLLMTLSIIPGALAVILRFRRANERERQQLKWFTYASTLILIALASAYLINFIGDSIWRDILIVLDIIAIPCLPVATAIAILRHRLYDIDVIINRTLVYGSVSATLALVYFSSVFTLQALALFVLGQTESQFAVVLSTLGIATLFNPLRRRIQTSIDRRFYRRKYDMTQTLTAFGAALRDEVDLTHLTSQLLTVVEKTMQPEHIALWLRLPPEEERANDG